MTIGTIVISLQSSLERQAFQQAQLNKLGIPLELLAALTPEDIDGHHARINFDRWERPLMPTEQACFLSHFDAWQAVLLRGTPTLILEDDAVLSSRTPFVLSALESLNGVEHVSLETRLRKKLLGRAADLSTDIAIKELVQDRTGAAAYVLWPIGAQRLCDHALRYGGALADAFISNLDELRSSQAIPAMAIQSDMAQMYGVNCPLKTRSYIQLDSQKAQFKASGLKRLVFKLRRIKSQAKQARKYLASIPNASRALVALDPKGFTFIKR